MAAPSFGATVALLERRRLAAIGIATSGKVGDDAAEDAIAEIAGDVEVEIRAAGLTPTAITVEASPVSWEWLQSTILYGAARNYLRTAGHSDMAETYAEEYRLRMGRLRGEPGSVLVDLPAPTDSTGEVSVYR